MQIFIPRFINSKFYVTKHYIIIVENLNKDIDYWKHGCLISYRIITPINITLS